MGQTIAERREIFHALRLNENLDQFNPAVNSYFDQAQLRFLQQTGDPAAAHQMALQSLEDLREQQASSLSYFDAFLIFRSARSRVGIPCPAYETLRRSKRSSHCCRVRPDHHT